MDPVKPAPLSGFVDPLGIPCPTHKVPAGQVCGYLDGDGAACCWRICAAAPPAPPPDDLTIAAINRSLKVMAEHGGGTPDYIGGLPVPVAEPPYPFICTSVDDVAETFRRSTGVPVAFVTDVPALRVALGSVTEMEVAMRRTAELVHWLAPFAFAYAAEHPESNMPTKVDVDDAYRAAMALLTRIDEAKART